MLVKRNMAPSLSCVENRAIPHSLQRSSVLAELQIHAHEKGLEAGRCWCSIRCSILWTQWLLFSRSELRPVRYMTDSWLFHTNDMLAIAHMLLRCMPSQGMLRSEQVCLQNQSKALPPVQIHKHQGEHKNLARVSPAGLSHKHPQRTGLVRGRTHGRRSSIRTQGRFTIGISTQVGSQLSQQAVLLMLRVA